MSRHLHADRGGCSQLEGGVENADRKVKSHLLIEGTPCPVRFFENGFDGSGSVILQTSPALQCGWSFARFFELVARLYMPLSTLPLDNGAPWMRVYSAQ